MESDNVKDQILSDAIRTAIESQKTIIKQRWLIGILCVAVVIFVLI